MRLIIPLILIALLLPYATSDDDPSGEWLIPPNPNMGVVLAAADAADSPVNRQHASAMRPATQPACHARARRR